MPLPCGLKVLRKSVNRLRDWRFTDLDRRKPEQDPCILLGDGFPHERSFQQYILGVLDIFVDLQVEADGVLPDLGLPAFPSPYAAGRSVDRHVEPDQRLSNPAI